MDKLTQDVSMSVRKLQSRCALSHMFLISFPVSRMRFDSVFSCSRVLQEAGWLLGLLENVGNESENLRVVRVHARACVCVYSQETWKTKLTNDF